MRTMLKILVFFQVVILLGACESKDSTNGDSLDELLRSGLDSLMLKSNFAAVSMGVVIGDDWRTYHVGEIAPGKQADDHTLYEIASLTKTFTGTLLAGAVSNGRVSVDDDIRAYLPGDYPNLEYDGTPISFRHILTHTSGLPRMFPVADQLFKTPDYSILPGQINDLQQGYGKEDFLQALQAYELDTVPGARLNYSNAGANTLGFCLENIFQERYPELLKKYLFQPLGMEDARMIGSDLGGNKLAIGTNDEGVEMPMQASKYMSAEGGILASTSDMVKYLAYQLNTRDEVVQTAQQHLWEGRLGDFDAGYFWQIRKHGAAADEVFQNGGAFGTSSWLSFYPEEQFGVFIVTNVAGPQVHQTMNNFLGQLHQALVEQQLLPSSSKPMNDEK